MILLFGISFMNSFQKIHCSYRSVECFNKCNILYRRYFFFNKTKIHNKYKNKISIYSNSHTNSVLQMITLICFFIEFNVQKFHIHYELVFYNNYFKIQFMHTHL